MKAAKEHRVPLSLRAAAMLESLKPLGSAGPDGFADAWDPLGKGRAVLGTEVERRHIGFGHDGSGT